MTVLKRMSRVRVAALLAGFIFLVFGLTACGQPTLPGGLGQLQQVAASCPTGKKIAAQAADDETGSSTTDAIRAARIAIIKAVAQRTLVCGGHLQVVAFSDSSGGTAVLFDQELPTLPGAALTARLRRAPAELEKLDAAIDEAMATPPALAQRGSDIVGQLRLASEYGTSLGAGYQLESYLLTDGEQNVSMDLVGAAAAGQDMTALAQTVEVPNLTAGARVTIAGVGQTAGDPVASTVIDGLVTFYKALCARTGAESCQIVTTLSPDAVSTGTR